MIGVNLWDATLHVFFRSRALCMAPRSWRNQWKYKIPLLARSLFGKWKTWQDLKLAASACDAAWGGQQAQGSLLPFSSSFILLHLQWFCICSNYAPRFQYLNSAPSLSPFCPEVRMYLHCCNVLNLLPSSTLCEWLVDLLLARAPFKI